MTRLALQGAHQPPRPLPPAVRAPPVHSYATELELDTALAKTPLEEFRGLCVLLTTSVAVSKKVKEDCKALEALLDGMRVGYTVIDGMPLDALKSEGIYLFSTIRCCAQASRPNAM